jgi:hypothetical protein
MAVAIRHAAALGAANPGGAPPPIARVRHFKPSQDPAFTATLRDVVGLYLDPPAHSLVLSVDEKSQIQAVDRTQPGLADEEGSGREAGTMTHDYIRHGTTTLSATRMSSTARSSACMARHRHNTHAAALSGALARRELLSPRQT